MGLWLYNMSYLISICFASFNLWLSPFFFFRNYPRPKKLGGCSIFCRRSTWCFSRARRISLFKNTNLGRTVPSVFPNLNISYRAVFENEVQLFDEFACLVHGIIHRICPYMICMYTILPTILVSITVTMSDYYHKPVNSTTLKFSFASWKPPTEANSASI